MLDKILIPSGLLKTKTDLAMAEDWVDTVQKR